MTANPLAPDVELVVSGAGPLRNVTYYPDELAQALLQAEQAIQRVCREAHKWLIVTPTLQATLNRLLLAQMELLRVRNYNNVCLLPGCSSPLPLAPAKPRRARHAKAA